MVFQNWMLNNENRPEINILVGDVSCFITLLVHFNFHTTWKGNYWCCGESSGVCWNDLDKQQRSGPSFGRLYATTTTQKVLPVRIYAKCWVHTSFLILTSTINDVCTIEWFRLFIGSTDLYPYVLKFKRFFIWFPYLIWGNFSRTETTTFFLNLNLTILYGISVLAL